MPPADDLHDYKLETTFHENPNLVSHIELVSDPARGIRRRAIIRKWIPQVPFLGAGTFGTVRLETLLDDGMRANTSLSSSRAVKILDKMQMQRTRIDYRKELSALAKFSKSKFKQHEVFVHFLGWFENDTHVYIAMEYFPLGSLDRFMDEESFFYEGEVKTIAVQLLEGLKIMHEEDFTHRDLKPQNIFVVRASPDWWVKIGDFGISKRVANDETALQTHAGTPHYLAPEISHYVRGENTESGVYTNAVDIWSFACVIYQLLAGQLPFPRGPLDLIPFCEGTPFPEVPLAVRTSISGIAFMKTVLVPRPHLRPSAVAALEAPWLRPETEASVRSQRSRDPFDLNCLSDRVREIATSSIPRRKESVQNDFREQRDLRHNMQPQNNSTSARDNQGTAIHLSTYVPSKSSPESSFRHGENLFRQDVSDRTVVLHPRELDDAQLGSGATNRRDDRAFAIVTERKYPHPTASSRNVPTVDSGGQFDRTPTTQQLPSPSDYQRVYTDLGRSTPSTIRREELDHDIPASNLSTHLSQDTHEEVRVESLSPDEDGEDTDSEYKFNDDNDDVEYETSSPLKSERSRKQINGSDLTLPNNLGNSIGDVLAPDKYSNRVRHGQHILVGKTLGIKLERWSGAPKDVLINLEIYSFYIAPTYHRKMEVRMSKEKRELWAGMLARRGPRSDRNIKFKPNRIKYRKLERDEGIHFEVVRKDRRGHSSDKIITSGPFYSSTLNESGRAVHNLRLDWRGWDEESQDYRLNDSPAGVLVVEFHWM